MFATSLSDIEKALVPKTLIDLVTKLPLEYYGYLNVFSYQESDKLPVYRLYDYSIKLKEGKEPPYGLLYRMSQDELLVLKNYLKENLSKGFIRASRSPATTPVLFAKKLGGRLRFCVDYQGLNAITIKNRYLLPLICKTLDQLGRAKFYIKIDIIATFNKLQIIEGEE